LPTPAASKYKSNIGGAQGRVGKERLSLHGMAEAGIWPTPKAHEHMNENVRGNPTLNGAAKLWPTPKARDAKRGGSKAEWKRHTPDLNVQAKRWPTPQVGGQGGRKEWANQGKGGKDLTSEVQSATGGQLNPTWVEWLMGWPSGWTDLQCSETEWFHFKRHMRSELSMLR